ncbi:hypothetical protein ABIA00_003458 [Bradyrhizobium ottawaense]|uniref:hypothetical protein n=1 Tax=Bradyrhizobium ottawaense TaxID=931866 RepID=UPI003834E6D0
MSAARRCAAAELLGTVLREVTENYQGQTGLGRKPALDVGWVRANWAAKPVPVEHLLGNGGGPASASLDCLGGREGILKEVAAKVA